MPRTILALLLAAGASGASWAQDVTYRKNIAPLVTQKCGACHGAGSPSLGEFQENSKKFEAMLKGPKLDTYADLIMLVGWPDSGAIMRRLDDGKNTTDRKPGNMYQNLGTTEEERQRNLNLFKAWVGKDAWKLNRWQARGAMPAITKEDLDKIKVKY